jgi:predicted  nucleic acid-binding Zn-ribbon protein
MPNDKKETDTLKKKITGHEKRLATGNKEIGAHKKEIEGLKKEVGVHKKKIADIESIFNIRETARIVESLLLQVINDVLRVPGSAACLPSVIGANS